MLQKIRSAAFSIFLVLAVLVMGLACLPVALFGRNAARETVKLWAKLALGALKVIAGISFTIDGQEHIPQGGAIVAANHQSMWETIALYALIPKPVMIFKKELLRIPVYGWWAGLAGNIPVDRSGGAKSLRAMTRMAKERIKAGGQIIVFPEGTRTAPGERAAFKSGAAGLYVATQAPCIPAAHNSGQFWRHPGGEKKPGVITLRFLAPIPPGLDRKTFTQTLKDRIEHARPDLEGVAKGAFDG